MKVFSADALTVAGKQAYKISNANVASRPQGFKTNGKQQTPVVS